MFVAKCYLGKGLRGARLKTENWVLAQALLHCSVTLNETLGLSFPLPYRGGRCYSRTDKVPRLDTACVPTATFPLTSNEPGTKD